MSVLSLEPLIRRFFDAWGPIAYRFKWPLFILPLLLTVGLSFGFLRLGTLRIDDPAYVFTPSDARWRRELRSFSENWPLNENKFLPGKSFETKRFVNVLIRARDGGSILREEVLKEIQVLNQWISNNISVPTDDGRFNLTYQDLCLSYDWVCGGNEHIDMLLQRNKIGNFLDLSYPRGGNKDTPVYLGTVFGDVELFRENNTVKSAKITQLFYFLKQEQSIVRRYSSEFSYADGLGENAERFAPNFVVSFTTLSIYALVSAFCFKPKPHRGIDWIRSKPWLACAGLSTTLMSIICGFGSLMLMGVSYNVINTIIPFLIIAIGIDDMFIMSACWEQSDEHQPVPVRMSQTLSHAGVAVTITNVTDIMSFAIGCITDLPGIQLFCLYACVSVAYCYLFQITYFCGFMAISGDLERQKRHCLFFYKTVGSISIADLNKSHREETVFPANFRKFQRTKSSNTPKTYPESSPDASFYSGRSISDGSDKTHATPPPAYQHVVQSGHNKEPSGIVKWLGESYGPFILTNSMRSVAAVLFLIYIVGAYYGCVNFREGLNPGNLVTKDHYISQYFEDIKSFWKSGPQLHVAVLDPPDLISSKTREQLLSTVSAFEGTEYTLGREGTVFFLLEYLNYLDQLNVEVEDTPKLWRHKLRSWLKYTGGSSQWASDIKFNETTGAIEAFRFCIALKNIVEPNQHKLAAKLMREIADSQPFHVEVYHEAFPFADQYLIILPAMVFNVVISLLCMTVVSLLMVPSLPSGKILAFTVPGKGLHYVSGHKAVSLISVLQELSSSTIKRCGIIIFLSIVSINIGVFGYMTLWGVNLDAVSMISIIMSIGFAVDLSGHIVYAFVTSHGDTSQRVIGALEALGWPIFQGASSTIAGITILYTVDAYIILVFFKTIWLTMVIGAIHGLFFIPVFLSIFPVGFFRIPKSSELH
ncbi:hypothetical protein Y032_0029g1968 [Ancylostoma ceylanicum]|uniref:SSD domain-containing protein n=1 Tax=Ancylostoma ceylanicum TaxID=53326 RepID=A0A016URA3_9BILA|nr:hypothetical protein Y032_0029g1968 [Ancylostoma ceylanicum]